MAEYSLETSADANIRAAAQFVKPGRNWRPVVGAASSSSRCWQPDCSCTISSDRDSWPCCTDRNLPQPQPQARLPASPDIQRSVPNQTKAQPGRASGDAQASDPVPGATLALSIGIEKPGYLKVVADGQTVFHERVRAGYSHNFQARSTLEIVSSRASGVRLNLNGQSVPFPPTPGRMARVELSKSDLRPLGGVH